MGDEITQPASANSGSGDITDITDSNLMTDISQIVSGVVGKERNERRRQKIREELVRDYISANQQDSPSLSSQILGLFKRN